MTHSDSNSLLTRLAPASGGSPSRPPAATQVTLALLAAWLRDGELSAADREACWRLGAPFQPELARRGLDSVLYLTSGVDVPAQRVYDQIQAAQRAAARAAVVALAEEGIAAVVVKGAELVPRLLGGRGFHVAGDTDLLVGRKQLGATRRVLQGLGYLQAGLDGHHVGLLDLDPIDIASVERGHYELFPFRRLVDLEISEDERAAVRDGCRGPTTTADGAPVYHGPLWERLWLTPEGRCVLALELDVHFRLAHEFEPDALVARAVPSALGAGLTLSPTDHAWFIAARFYMELRDPTYRSLRPLALLGRWLAEATIEWPLLIEIATQLRWAPAMYYVLSFLDRLAPGRVPEEVLATLHPMRNDRTHDHGWRFDRMFDVVSSFPLGW